MSAPKDIAEVVNLNDARLNLSALRPGLVAAYRRIHQELKPRQRKYVIAVATGAETPEEARNRLGIKPKTVQDWESDPVYTQIFDALLRESALQHETPKAYKRARLHEIVASGLTMDTASGLNAAIKALELLSRLDGDLDSVTDHGAGRPAISISINCGSPQDAAIIEAERAQEAADGFLDYTGQAVSGPENAPRTPPGLARGYSPALGGPDPDASPSEGKLGGSGVPRQKGE